MLLSSAATPARHHQAVSSKRNVVKMTMSVIVGFVVCWTPYFVVSLIRIYTNYRVKFTVALSVSEIMALAHSALNPLLYILFSRRAVKTSCWQLRRRVDGILSAGRFWGRSPDQQRRAATKRPRVPAPDTPPPLSAVNRRAAGGTGQPAGGGGSNAVAGIPDATPMNQANDISGGSSGHQGHSNEAKRRRRTMLFDGWTSSSPPPEIRRNRTGRHYGAGSAATCCSAPCYGCNSSSNHVKAVACKDGHYCYGCFWQQRPPTVGNRSCCSRGQSTSSTALAPYQHGSVGALWTERSDVVSHPVNCSPSMTHIGFTAHRREMI